MIVIRHGSSVLKPGASTLLPAISPRRPGTDAASERFAIMAEHSTSVLIEIRSPGTFLSDPAKLRTRVSHPIPLRQHRADGLARGEESVTALAAERDVAEIVIAPRFIAAHIVSAERRGFGQSELHNPSFTTMMRQPRSTAAGWSRAHRRPFQHL
jgi:hypothetical protein